MDPSSWLAFLLEIVERTDPIALERFRAQDLHVEEKPDRSILTEADLRVEEEARRLVAARHPEIGVFGEEQGESVGRASMRLIIDPIDATANFARGIPVFATLLAIEDKDEIVAGVVSAPALGARWTAARGAGAWSGRRRLRVSGISDVSKAQVFHGSIGGNEVPRRVPGMLDLLQGSLRQRGFGDFYQHMLVAEGAGEVAIDPIMNPWDIAPLLLIVEEAGGRATTLAGERTIYGRNLVSTNAVLHDRTLAILAGRGE
jgi:histidinol-phosphatase